MHAYSVIWTGYKKNLDALATYDDSCMFDPTQPQCKAVQALSPYRFIVSGRCTCGTWHELGMQLYRVEELVSKSAEAERVAVPNCCKWPHLASMNCSPAASVALACNTRHIRAGRL